MNKDIKEILDDMKQMPIDESWALNLEDYQCKLLLNYITNLQKENEIQKKDNESLKKFYNDLVNKYEDLIEKYQDYKSRNEKAIEWCECVVNAKYTSDKLPNGETTDMGYCLDLAEPLLNILEGGDE